MSAQLVPASVGEHLVNPSVGEHLVNPSVGEHLVNPSVGELLVHASVGELLVHASCVSWDGTGVLLRGASGAGKSDLALRLIDLGAVLVADDQVRLARRDDQLLASPPEALAGLLEVRGIGILKFDYRAPVAIGLVVDLVTEDRVERLPEPARVVLCDCSIKNVWLSALQASAPNKVRLAVQHEAGSIMTPT